MSFKIVDFTPASAVASAGTFAPSYPTGFTAGSFAAYGHKMYAEGLQNLLSQDAGDFSISFGASTFTVTYNGSTTLPAGKGIKMQLNIAGVDDLSVSDVSHMKRMKYATPVFIDLGAPKATDDNGICESQTVTGAGTAFVYNGVQSDLVGGVAPIYLDVPRALTAAWTNTAVITITGKDEYGDVIVEKSASGTSHTGTKAFSEITSITTSATITSAIVGWGDVIGLPVYVDKVGRILGEYKDGVLLPRTGGGKVYLQGLALEAAVDGATGLNFVSPVAGEVVKVSLVAQTAVTTGGAVTAEINTVAINGLSVTIANSGSEGDVDSDTATRDHATALVAVGDRIEVQFAAAIDGSSDLMIVIEIEATYVPQGTFVAGVQTLPTATTGDTKGTYDPASACDGALSFSLLVAVPDPTYKGVDNYDG